MAKPAAATALKALLVVVTMLDEPSMARDAATECDADTTEGDNASREKGASAVRGGGGRSSGLRGDEKRCGDGPSMREESYDELSQSPYAFNRWS